MWPSVITKVDSISYGSRGMLNALDAMTVDALLFQRPNDPLDHPVLLRAVVFDNTFYEVTAGVGNHQSHALEAALD